MLGGGAFDGIVRMIRHMAENVCANEEFLEISDETYDRPLECRLSNCAAPAEDIV